MQALLLISHGSRSDEATGEVETLTREIRQRSGLTVVKYAYLDVRSPTIAEGVEACVREGASRITVLLHFLNSGNHVLEDIPKHLEQARKHYPDVVFDLTPPVGLHEKLPELFLDIVQDS